MEVSIGGIKATYQIAGKQCALLCPPHPLMGGNRFDVRLERISEKLNDSGISTLAFDYKGYRDGIGEIEDAKICIKFLRQRHSAIFVIGYSFGSVVASNVADLCDVAVYISPLPSIGSIKFADCGKNKLFIIAKRDQFVSLGKSFLLYQNAKPPKDFLILDTDHFYFGKFDVLAEKICNFLSK
ncbi:MAG: alpha/beta hydrolase [Archaeoglobaceae archaeon]|uniref:Alpha/beta hydrolase n=1 Tax=Archaeoglobus fulgidus TaxID=2234 RepID=A0A7J3M1U8_ARCFL